MIIAKYSTVSMLDPQPNLTWSPLKTTSGGKSASFVCPNGHYGTLLDHKIASDGRVTPSVACSECSFHEVMKLEGWEP